MKQILAVIIILGIAFTARSQYYAVPDWFSNMPQSNDSCIYAIGISEPRMEDTALATKVALSRAFCVASLLNKSLVSYASDYYETQSEEHRSYIMKETYQELAKIECSFYVTRTDYQIVQQEFNDNGEMIVLVRFNRSTKPPNVSVCAEYFRQDFEVSNTRSLESIRSVMISFENIIDSDTLKAKYKAMNMNGSMSFEINYDTISIKPKGYYYTYTGSQYDSIDISAFSSVTSLEKGLWNAFSEALMNSVIRKTKNYKTKFEVVDDSYFTAIDQSPDKSTGSLSRQVSRNEMQFKLGSIFVDKNNLMHLSLLYPDEYQKPYIIVTEKQVDDKKLAKNERKCFLKKIFKKKDIG